MTGTTEENPFDARRRRAHANSAGAMNGVGFELNRLAEEAEKRVFEHVGLSASQDQEARVSKLFSEMETGVIQPEKTTGPSDFRQSNAAIAQHRERHADLALHHAVGVKYIYRTSFFPETAAITGDITGILKSFRRMQSALLEAERHLAALEILKKLERKHYSQRARKGGHARSRPASERDQQTLIDVMVKNMLYNDPGAIKCTQSGLVAVAHLWAERIYRLNREFQFADIESLDQLQSHVHSFLLKRLKAGQDVSDLSIQRKVMAAQLQRRHDAFDNEDTARIKAELSYERGYREGAQYVLAHLLEERFGDLPDTAHDVIRATHKFGDLLTYLDRLPEAASWQDVMQQRASAS